jgi:zinc transport system substrate-binding protein
MEFTITKKILLAVFLISAVLFSEAPVHSSSNDPLQVVVSILPQKYFVGRIAGEFAGISVMVPPGSNPATYEPKPSQMLALRNSKLYFAINVPFERAWLKKIAGVNPGLEIVHTDQLVKKGVMTSLDPHIWLSPPLVKLQARVIADALIRADPAREEIYQRNLLIFNRELDQLDAEIRGIFAGSGQATEFLVFHPSWGYFAAAYGLTQIPVEIEGKEPSLTETVKLIKYARAKGIKIIFVQPQFATKSAEAIAREIGARVVIADPLSQDWANNLREVAAKFKAALR